jgi:hypothetical protein
MTFDDDTVIILVFILTLPTCIFAVAEILPLTARVAPGDVVIMPTLEPRV